jgi:hypothetical protein
MARTRERRRRGVMPVTVEVSYQEIDYLRRRGYGAQEGDRLSIAEHAKLRESLVSSRSQRPT